MTRSATALLACTLVFTLSCTKQDDNGMYGKNLREVNSYFQEIGFLDRHETYDVDRNVISRDTMGTVYLSAANDRDAGYYYNLNVTYNVSGANETTILPPAAFCSEIWPGNLVQGESLQSGRPATIPLYDERKPGRIYLNVVSGFDMQYYRDVERLSGSNVNQAMNDILAPYGGGLPANISFSYKSVESVEEMAYELNMNHNDFSSATENKFESLNWKSSKTRVMVKLTQVFFTMAYEPNTLANIFNEGLTMKKLEPYTGPGNPMCFISSVSYGRYFVLLYESNETETTLISALNKAMNKEHFEEDFTVSERRALYTSSVSFVQYGGNAQSGLAVATTRDPEAMRKFIIDEATFSKDDNVGVPIQYNVCYAYNCQPVNTYSFLNTNYTKTEYSPVVKENDVRITINDLSSPTLVLTDGKRTISNQSNFTVSDITVTLNKPGSKPQTIGTVPSGITNVGTRDYPTNKAYNKTFSTGKLGVNTEATISIAFNVTYHNQRYGNGTAKETRTYAKLVTFYFNRTSQKWEVSHSDLTPGYTYTQNANFKYMAIRDNFNFCDVSFRLNYTFYTNMQKYPI